jgi:RES domain-containing protein
LTFTSDELTAIEDWIKRARSLKGIYYRSVEYRYMDPGEVLRGTGTELYGGRFAEVGVRAVYLAGSDETASREVLARKNRLGGDAQISLEKYPRVIFAVSVSLQRVVTWLRSSKSGSLNEIRQACLLPDDLERSQQVGKVLREAGVQGLVFPSVVGAGRNLIVYLDNCEDSALILRNADKMRKRIGEISRQK